MKNQLRSAVEDMKRDYIQRLIQAGVYKQDDHQLYELTLSELESEHKTIIRKKTC